MKAALPVAAFVALVVAANVATNAVGLVHVGFGQVVTAGTFAAGLAFLVRDWAQEAGGRRIVLVAVAVGALASWWLTSPALAVASGVAFAVSELADWVVYEPLRSRNKWAASAASNAVGALVDSWLFLALAGFPVWPASAAQATVKTALTMAALIAVGVGRAVLRNRVRAAGA